MVKATTRAKPALDTRPLTPERWDDLATVFGGAAGKGDCGRCWCMYWRLTRADFDAGMGAPHREAFRAIVEAGPPPGLIAYDGAGPVGWVQVTPRAAVAAWNAPTRITAPERPGDAADAGVWGVSCFVTRVGNRRRGVGAALLDGAIAWARAHGARVLDACPVDVEDKRPSANLYHGVASTFRKAGFKEVARRRDDRPLMRLELSS